MKVYEVHENDLMSPSNDSTNWLKRVCLAEEVDEEIERLKKVLKDIGDEAMNIPENSQEPELNEGINTILMMAEQALKEK